MINDLPGTHSYVRREHREEHLSSKNLSNLPDQAGVAHATGRATTGECRFNPEAVFRLE